jgi:hypothetical protein
LADEEVWKLKAKIETLSTTVTSLEATITELRNLIAKQEKVIDAFDTQAQINLDFDLVNIPPRMRKNLPSLLDWWDKELRHQATGKTVYLPFVLTIGSSVIGGIAIAVILHAFHLGQ